MDVLRLIWLCSFKDSKQLIYTSGGIAFETSDANTKKLWVSWLSKPPHPPFLLKKIIIVNSNFTEVLDTNKESKAGHGDSVRYGFADGALKLHC